MAAQASRTSRGLVLLRTRWPWVALIAGVASVAALAFVEPSSRARVAVAYRPFVPLSAPAPSRDTSEPADVVGVLRDQAASRDSTESVATHEFHVGAADALRNAARNALARKTAAAPVPMPATVQVDTPPPEPVKLAAAPPVSSRPLIAQNRWQMMTDAIGQCEGGLLDRLACEQKTRLRYCDGYWGNVAQCPAGIANDHGQ